MLVCKTELNSDNVIAYHYGEMKVENGQDTWEAIDKFVKSQLHNT